MHVQTFLSAFLQAMLVDDVLGAVSVVLMVHIAVIVVARCVLVDDLFVVGQGLWLLFLILALLKVVLLLFWRLFSLCRFIRIPLLSVSIAHVGHVLFMASLFSAPPLVSDCCLVPLICSAVGRIW